ncbi:Acetolactate synthase isozyme 1 small subunit [Providencia rustigianii]|uniref:acetolactate synthase n=2 Tax=Providencia rustigianii TaxID=158850 RepID=D1P6U6_9GAMM|nr:MULTISPECIES: acetolactate synthase small subunit [Providencia]EFB70793.1 acetolactate synthase 1 regulatory subunit [Providencia rustigianii DSM 4541]MTC56177.1 acetolactate synthase small subunit [Providencia rustigianii]SPY76442.1 Acetolactate synthase isozyme 1 small subunit [Providencia rustigianii]SUC25651.1 Acetolactate synthase isozyme 1 small subunit [Providencia rustigianii]SUC34404.1 Acetolactate synthase isozyme 1 small subunit [Providencia rustigianii]
MEFENHPIALELIVRNHPGVMSHICGLFARRAFNVDAILCLPIKGRDESRIWLLVEKDDRLSQMVNQVEKLEDVREVRFSDDLRVFETMQNYLQ